LCEGLLTLKQETEPNLLENITMPSSSSSSSSSPSFDEEWEEWDGKSSFWHHCIAGSLAGLAEHVTVYPLDTVRTHIQVCAACNVHPGSTSKIMHNGVKSAIAKQGVSVLQTTSKSNSIPANYGMWQTMRHLMSQPVAAVAGAATTAASNPVEVVGITRLWRGVHTILIGCIPAHALYFSSYEMVKAATLDPKTQEVTTYGSALAGAAAVLSHDLILAPLDTVKQRLQIGHYRGMSHALSTMIQSEGYVSLYRSFPVTLATNIPYGMVMVGTNEFLKQEWNKQNEPLSLSTTMAASSVAGLIAAATTTPLDRIKTYLQTQQLKPACSLTVSSIPPDHCPLRASNNNKVVVHNWHQAATRIYQNEGTIGFFRGMLPRILSHTPAVAISWTTYETAKKYLKSVEW
jgi:solute carrier family 25 iron transporter 28/37